MNKNDFTTPTSPIVIECDDIIHTVERPFCSDSTCPCHDSDEARQLLELMLSGQISPSSWIAIYWDQPVRERSFS